MMTRFTLPAVGAPESVTLPPITRSTLANGLGVWSMRHASLPMVSAALLLNVGSVDDPPEWPGLASLAADLVDEGSGDLDAIAIADRWARLGCALETDAGPDATTFSFMSLSRVLGDALRLLAASVCDLRVDAATLARVRELRVNRLRQLQSSAAASADRVFLRAVYGAHGYAHTPLGTTRALSAVTREHILAFQQREYRPDRATIIVAGDVTHDACVEAAAAAFAGWRAGGDAHVAASPSSATPAPEPRIWLVDRPGAPQSELRLGHLGVARSTSDYYALVTLNSLLGGQFSSRINQRLRQDKGYTYGARTHFDFWRRSGTFECETSVQGDVTGAAIADVLAACEAVGASRPPDTDELVRTQESLTRGYVRHFETPAQFVRAAAEIAVHDLPDDTVGRFVPSILAVSAAAVVAAARAHIRPRDMAIVIVGDAASVRPQLVPLGRAVVDGVPEF
jgi:zinc protease